MKQVMKIELEGCDGSGKSTALRYISEQIQKKDMTVCETREVGNPHIPICVKLRELVLAPGSNLDGKAMECIFSAMRIENEHWLYKLKLSSDAPDFVLSDRGWLSHLAYTDHNVNPEFTEDLYLKVLENHSSLPDVVIYFSVNTQTALQRRVRRGEGMADVIEAKGVEFQEKVRQSFEKYIDRYSNRIAIYTVDANQSKEGVQRQLDTILQELTSIGTEGYFRAQQGSL